MQSRRVLFWAALVCAMVFPLAAQANVYSLPLTAPAAGCQISAQECHMTGCACPCCQHSGTRGHKSSCRCQSISLRCLPTAGESAPVQQDSPSYVFFLAPQPSLLITDIFRPPQKLT